MCVSCDQDIIQPVKPLAHLFLHEFRIPLMLQWLNKGRQSNKVSKFHLCIRNLHVIKYSIKPLSTYTDMLKRQTTVVLYKNVGVQSTYRQTYQQTHSGTNLVCEALNWQTLAAGPAARSFSFVYRNWSVLLFLLFPEFCVSYLDSWQCWNATVVGEHQRVPFLLWQCTTATVPLKIQSC